MTSIFTYAPALLVSIVLCACPIQKVPPHEFSDGYPGVPFPPGPGDIGGGEINDVTVDSAGETETTADTPLLDTSTDSALDIEVASETSPDIPAPETDDTTDTTDTTDTNDTPDIPNIPADPIATIQFNDPAFGGAFFGLNVIGEQATSTTDVTGVVELPVVADSPFQLYITAEGFPIHRLHGIAGTSSFSLRTTALNNDRLNGLLGNVGLIPQQGLGHIVVGLFDANDLPALQATASLNTPSSAPITIAATLAQPSGIIGPGNEAWLIFPNVSGSSATLTLIGAEGTTCRVAAAGESQITIPVAPGSITLVSARCD